MPSYVVAAVDSAAAAGVDRMATVMPALLAFPLLLLWRCLCLQGFGLVKINCEMKNILLEL